ncbi:unnamed protein product, partial [Mesorhabditis belari]|uniref:Uncharacterized protein n=1 Tax=Mesorhabditis belari TaxID=2138241 RepID=A0AAF3EVV1_9BILA
MILRIFLLLIISTQLIAKKVNRKQQLRAHHYATANLSPLNEELGRPRFYPIVEMDEGADSIDDEDLTEYIDSIIDKSEQKNESLKSTTTTTASITEKLQGSAEKPRNGTGKKYVRGDASSDTEIIKKLLNKGYDWRVRPPGINLTLPGSHGPVVVAVNMLIRSISKIDDVNMEYSVQMTFRESWVDGRLAYGILWEKDDNLPEFIILTAGQQIWMPDSFFQNEKMAQKHNIDKPNVLIRIHKDGRILYSVRISMVLSCPMHLQYYPMDVQTCFIDLASYAYTTEDIEYVWKDKDPVQLKEGLNSSLPSFQLKKVGVDYCTSKTNTGTYSCLRTILELKRQFSYYLLQLYVPSTMLVIVSWVSFWLDRSAVPARVTLGVTTLLTMTTQASGINAKLPPVSYTKAIDVWIGACLTFIFGALLEFAWVTYISSRNFYKGAKHDHRMSSVYVNKQQAMIIQNTQAIDVRTHPQVPQAVESEIWVKQGADPAEHLLLSGADCERRLSKPNPLERWMKGSKLRKWIRNYLDMDDPAKRADLLSRMLFPLTFVVFNIIYWTVYSSNGPYEQK